MDDSMLVPGGDTNPSHASGPVFYSLLRDLIPLKLKESWRVY